MTEELRKRIVQLEEMYAHQQHFIGQLNDALIDVRNELDQLKQSVDQQHSQIQWLTENQDTAGPANEKPPHY